MVWLPHYFCSTPLLIWAENLSSRVRSGWDQVIPELIDSDPIAFSSGVAIQKLAQETGDTVRLFQSLDLIHGVDFYFIRFVLGVGHLLGFFQVIYDLRETDWWSYSSDPEFSQFDSNYRAHIL